MERCGHGSLATMSITSAVANAAALAAAGAGKKAAQVQLQAEINTDDEWAKFLNKDGLLGNPVLKRVDLIYSITL